MPKTAQSFPPIETWMRMDESEQDAFLQAVENSRRRRALTIPISAIAILGAVIASACYYLL